MQDRPTAGELLQAVRLFLEQEVEPFQRDQRTRFRTLVAINALATVERELQHENAIVRAEVDDLSALLDRPPAPTHDPETLRALAVELNRELARRIRAGNPPAGVLDHLRRVVAAKLGIASPDYLRRHAGYGNTRPEP